MPKNLKILLVILIPVMIVAILSIGILPSLLKNARGRDGKEWFQKQEEYLDLFTVYSQSVDYIYSAYIAGVSSEDAFLEDLDVLEQELRMIQASYDKDLAESPVREGTMDYYMVQGCDGVYACFGSFRRMLEDTRKVSSDLAQVYYLYIAYADEITGNTTKYQVSKTFLSGQGQTKPDATPAAIPDKPTVSFAD